MARKARHTPGGYIYHVHNRSAGRIALFRNEDDYAAFERVLLEAHGRIPLRILAWCLMKNHWHFVVWPRTDDEVTAFFRWLSHTHAMRWRVARASVGWGHLYQGRFKAFPVERGHHLLEVCRYVERNALTAGAVKRAEDWRWGSLHIRCQKRGAATEVALQGLLTPRVVQDAGSLKNWVKYVNAVATKSERERLEASAKRGCPYGEARWVSRVAGQLELEHTMRPEGRPPKPKTEGAIP
jgi:putative transposase